jgi:hypothetical protein
MSVRVHISSKMEPIVVGMLSTIARTVADVRQTLSFSKSDEYHHVVTRWFIVQYNLGLSLTI